jgi:DNA-binding LacI/PurR family transcriptional regulator
LRGYNEALVGAGFEADPTLVAAGRFSREDAANACATLIETCPGITAIFCASDLMAYGALDELARRGLKVPQDIAVVGFDDTAFSSLDGISLSTVRFDVEALAENAVARLVERVEGRVGAQDEPVFDIQPCSLIHRRSTDKVMNAGEESR